MINISKVSVMNMDNAIRGARNPMYSWERADSYYDEQHQFVMGANDLLLATKLCKAGSDHRKFIRQIFVSVDIGAPLYWWKEYDTYKVATVANSTSTMHKIHAKEFTIEDFSVDQMNQETHTAMVDVIAVLEKQRLSYLVSKDKETWYSMIQLLPSSYQQLRTCTLNYETLRSIYFARRHHKLVEWQVVCEWIATLPYAAELILSQAE